MDGTSHPGALRGRGREGTQDVPARLASPTEATGLAPSVIHEFELAAEEKYWVAMELMTRGDGATGIYLMGYVAEMLLKNSYFLLDSSTAPTFPVGSQPALAKNAAKSVFLPKYPFTNYHDLMFWAALLAEKRRQEGRPLPPNMESALTQRV